MYHFMNHDVAELRLGIIVEVCHLDHLVGVVVLVVLVREVAERLAAVHQLELRDGQQAGEVSVVVLNELGQECEVVDCHMLSVCSSDGKYNRVGGYRHLIYRYDKKRIPAD